MSEIDDTNGTPSPPASPRQFLLGAFILFQLAFLIVSNLLGIIKYAPSDMPARPKKLVSVAIRDFAGEAGHGWKWAEQVEDNLTRWTQLTGQDQAWSLFAPTVAEATGFPCVLLTWDEPTWDQPMMPGTMFAYDEKNGFHLCAPWDPPRREPSLSTARRLGILAATNPWEALHLHTVQETQEKAPLPRVKMLISDNEPDDIHNYFRTGKCRLRRFEGQVYVTLQPREKAAATEKKPKIMETPDEVASESTRRVRRVVNDWHDVTLAYMKWRVKMWQAANPLEPGPKQVILFQRYYRIHGPQTDDAGKFLEERGWDSPVLWPIARWQPQHPNPNTSGWVLEYYDYTDRRFVPIR